MKSLRTSTTALKINAVNIWDVGRRSLQVTAELKNHADWMDKRRRNHCSPGKSQPRKDLSEDTKMVLLEKFSQGLQAVIVDLE